MCMATCPKQGIYVAGFSLPQVTAPVEAALGLIRLEQIITCNISKLLYSLLNIWLIKDGAETRIMPIVERPADFSLFPEAAGALTSRLGGLPERQIGGWFYE